MTARDLRLIAERISTLPDTHAVSHERAKELVAEHFADELARSFPRFKRGVFVAACKDAS